MHQKNFNMIGLNIDIKIYLNYCICYEVVNFKIKLFMCFFFN
jgi:hypothetical protein